MQVRIVEKRFGGVEFAPEMKVLHLGGQSSANVERLEFTLPESWQGKSVTLHIQRQDGTLPAPILLDEAHSCAVGKEFTASGCGSWMLLALGEDGFRALTRPAKYDCYETLATDGDAEISPTQYETFVARVLAYSNSAATSAQEARNSAGAAAKDAKRAEAAADRAEKTVPADGPVKSVNGKGGAVTLTAADVGALEAGSADYVERIELNGQVMTLTMGDGSTRTLQTKDTTALDVMTGVLGVKHGGTGKDTALTAEDVGAYGKNETYAKTEVYSQKEADAKFGTPYSLPPATAAQLGGVKVGEALDIAPDGTLSAKTLNDKIAAAVAVKSEPRLVWNYHTKSPTKWKTYDVSIPDGVDYVHIKTKCDTYTGAEFDLVRGGNTSHVFDTTPAEVVCTMTFQADGTLHVQGPYSGMSYSYAIELWLSGYHYPTLADLLTQVTAVESSVTDLQVALCELYEEKEEN